MRVIYRKIRHALYLYTKRNVEKIWGARYTLGERYLSKNTVIVKRAQEDVETSYNLLNKLPYFSIDNARVIYTKKV